jgi:hypothetical protein
MGVTPRLGFEPKCSKGTTRLERAALVRSATSAMVGSDVRYILQQRLYLIDGVLREVWVDIYPVYGCCPADACAARKR